MIPIVARTKTPWLRRMVVKRINGYRYHRTKNYVYCHHKSSSDTSQSVQNRTTIIKNIKMTHPWWIDTLSEHVSTSLLLRSTFFQVRLASTWSSFMWITDPSAIPNCEIEIAKLFGKFAVHIAALDLSLRSSWQLNPVAIKRNIVTGKYQKPHIDVLDSRFLRSHERGTCPVETDLCCLTTSRLVVPPTCPVIRDTLNLRPFGD